MGNALKKIALSCKNIRIQSTCCTTKTIDKHVDNHVDKHITNIIYECHNCKNKTDRMPDVPLD